MGSHLYRLTDERDRCLRQIQNPKTAAIFCQPGDRNPGELAAIRTVIENMDPLYWGMAVLGQRRALAQPEESETP